MVCKSQYSALSHLVGAMLLAHDPQTTWIAMLRDPTAYLDDSGHPDDQEAVIIAGWVASLEQWLRLEVGWKQTLTDFGITSGCFHMTDFESDGPAYSHLSAKDKARLLDKLVSHIVTRACYSVCAIIPMADYRAVNDVFYMEEMFGKPYAIAGQMIMASLRTWQRNYAPDAPLVTIFDEGSKHKGDLIDMFIQQEFDAPAFRKKKNVVALQSADLLAWECFNSFKSSFQQRESLWRLMGVPFEHGVYGQMELIDAFTAVGLQRRDEFPDLQVALAKLPKKRRTRQIKA